MVAGPTHHCCAKKIINATKSVLPLAKMLSVIRIKSEEGTRPNSFYEASSTLILKPDKDIIRKENHKPIFLLNIDGKILNILAQHI